MADATGYPQRMRYSFEARGRAVALMCAGARPGRAAQTVGASRASGYRWWARYQAEGGAGLRERRSTPQRQPRRLSAADEATILAARAQWGRPRHVGRVAGPTRLDRRQGAAAVGALAPAPRPAAAGRALRARPARRAPAPGHEEAGPLLARRPAQPPRWPPTQSTSRVAARACGGGRPFTVGVRRGAAQCPSGRRSGLPGSRARLVPHPGRVGAGGDDGPRLGLSLPRLAAALRRPRAAPPAHPPLSAAHQRQSRTLHPDPAAALGLRRRLPLQRPPDPGPRRLAALV